MLVDVGSISFNVIDDIDDSLPLFMRVAGGHQAHCC